MIKKIITWDLGATKCAAALVDYDHQHDTFHCQQTTSIKIRSCSSLPDLSHQIENALGIKMTDADAICIGAAGQYDGEKLQLDKGFLDPDKNYPYPMAFAQLAREYQWPTFAVIHDYSPIVCSTFISDQHIQRLNHAEMNPHGRRVALGVGTGIGLKDGVLFENSDFWLGTNEMGHIGVTMPPLADKIYQERHNELLKFLRSDHLIAKDEPITFEKLLAGLGMVRLHSFFDREAKNKSAEEIGELVRKGYAQETLATFAWYLGLLAGTVQLTFMPDGGIWITGGVILNHLNVFEQPEFLIGIGSSPTYLNLRQQFPLNVLSSTDHAFMGSAYYASRKLLSPL